MHLQVGLSLLATGIPVQEFLTTVICISTKEHGTGLDPKVAAAMLC